MSCLDDVDVQTLVQLETALTDQTLDGFMEYVRRHFGLANVIYICPSFRGRSMADPFLATADHAGWAHRYIASGYASLDPTLSVGARSVHPIDWAWPPPGSGNVRSIFGEPSEAQIGRHGLTFPIRGPTDGLWAVFIATSDESHVEWYSRRQQLKKELAIVANYVHQRAYELQGQETPVDLDGITSRELEALEWIAEGRSVEDTAMTMRISAAAVRAHLDSARHKLQAVNCAHAVTKAIRRGLIH
jgi:LuxR family quorum-sensing system transcriptional regulator SinR